MYENAGTKQPELLYCMLDTLTTSCVLKWSAIQNRVQLIKATKDFTIVRSLQ